MASNSNSQPTDAGPDARGTRYRALIEHSADAVSLVAADGTILYASPATTRILGYPVDEYIGRNAFELIHPDDLSANAALFASITQTPGETAVSQFRCRHKDGTWRWLDVTGRNLLAEPDISAIIVNCRDITDHKQAEQEALRNSEALYRMLFESNPHPMWVYDLETLAFLAVNAAAVNHYGYSRDGFLAMTIKDIRPPEDLPTLIENLAQPPQKFERSGAWRHRTKDGRLIDVEITSHDLLFDGRRARLVLANDITKRKEAEAALRESETLYRALFENTPVGLGLADQTGKLLAFNDAMLKPGGYTREGFPRLDNVASLYCDPADRDAALALAGRQGFLRQHEARFKRRDGTCYDALLSLTPVVVNGETCWHAVVEDITDRKQAEDRLRLQSAALESAANAIVIADPDGNISWANPAFTRLTGYTLEEARGQNPRFLKSGQHDHAFYQQMWDTIRAGQIWRGELVNRRKDGTLYDEEMTITPVPEAQGKISHFVAIKQDIAERKQAEEALREHAFYLARLNDITQAAAGTLDFQTLMQTLADRLGELIHADGCYLTMWDETQQMPVPTAASGELRERYSSNRALPGEATMTASVLRAGRALVAEDVFNTPYLSPRIAAQYPARSVLGLPLLAGGQKLGAALIAFNQPHHFTPDEIARCEQAAGQIALAIAKARLLDAVQRELRERRQAEAELEHSLSTLKATLDSTGDGILVVGGSQIINFNQKFAAMWGIPRHILESGNNEQVMAHALPQLRNPEDFLARVSVLRADPAAIFDDTIELKDGRAVEVYSQPQALGGAIIGRVLSFRDITERKQHEREREAILTVATALRVAQLRAEMLPILLDQLLKLLGADSAAVGMYDSRTGEIIIELGYGEWATATGLRLPSGEGIGGLVVATGQPYLTNDMRGETRLVRPDFFKNTVTFASVPLIAQDQIIGVLWVGRGQDGGPAIYPDITADDLRLLTAIGEIAANAIHRAALHEQTRQRLEQLKALRAIDIAISSGSDLPGTLDTVFEQVAAQLGVDAAAVLLLDPQTQMLNYAAAQGFHSKIIEETRLRLGEGHAGRAALERRVVAIPNLTEVRSDPLLVPLLHTEGFISYYGVPLVSKGQVKGVLEVFHRTALNPDSDWLEFLETLAGQAAIAVDNIELFGSLQQSNQELALAYNATIEGWSRALDLRDKETEGHSRRVTEMTLRLAEAVDMSEAELVHVRRGALLHDIGKMGIPDNILLKPGPLTGDE